MNQPPKPTGPELADEIETGLKKICTCDDPRAPWHRNIDAAIKLIGAKTSRDEYYPVMGGMESRRVGKHKAGNQ